jgi:hypothetical protein
LCKEKSGNPAYCSIATASRYVGTLPKKQMSSKMARRMNGVQKKARALNHCSARLEADLVLDAKGFFLTPFQWTA